tara:strand:+ start:1553 stop:6796 length:5244 start_codon:yes stop_codon:yes gene_type:complete
MANKFTDKIFSDTYKDDYRDSDNYYRILFNSGRALQARELTQMQTIIQKEIERFGRNIYKEGASVNPGGPTLNTRYEFIKLDTGTNTLPADLSTIVNDEFIGQTSGFKFIVLEAVRAIGTDPATLYVRYTDTLNATANFNKSQKVSAGEDIVGTVSNTTLTVQTTDTTTNAATGFGSRISIDRGDFFTQGHFVFAEKQSKIISKYTSLPTATVGFKIQQDIVSSADAAALYDNQGATPNTSAPGADRYRIRLILATQDEIDSDENFVYFCRVINGNIFDVVTGNNQFKAVEDRMAQRTNEINGNFNVSPFLLQFEEDSDNTFLKAVVTPGLAYVNGYRAEKEYPTRIRVPRAQDTTTLENQVVAANYGNYVVVSSMVGVPDINVFQVRNLRSAVTHGGSTIGTCRVRYIEEDGANFKLYLFDVVMNAGQKFSDVRSIGASATDYANVLLDNGEAVLNDIGNNNLLFGLPFSRPKALSDISLEVQRKFAASFDASGQATLTLTATGETFANTADWIISVDSSGAVISDDVSVSGAGTQAATLSNGPTSSNVEVIVKVNKANGSVRTKTLLETTVTGAVESDGAGLKFLELEKPDLFKLDRLRDSDSDGVDRLGDFIVDNGQRDNWYSPARVILKGNKTAPSGNLFARFRYFQHGASGDFFATNSYTGQVAYGDIPSHRLNDGRKIELRDVLDFRPRKTDKDSDFTGGTARINELPTNTDLITTDAEFFLPRFDRLVIDQDANLIVSRGRSDLQPQFPDVASNQLLLYDINMAPFTISDSDIGAIPIDNKSFTMSDISSIEKKVDNLFELTTLSLLETGLSNFSVFDSTGNDRTKAGFLVDNFQDQLATGFDNLEYRASIDPKAQILRPSFTEENIKLIYDSDLSTNTIIKGDNVYAKYVEADYINQPQVSGIMNINPFNVITNMGQVTLSPASDDWRETRRIADNIISGGTETRISGSQAQLFNNSQWNWGGTQVGDTRSQGLGSSSSTGAARSSDTSNGASGNWRSATTTDTTSQVTTVTTRTAVARVASFSTIRTVVGDRVVDVAMIPFMRSRRVSFKAEGLKPNHRFFPFFDGIDVSNWTRSGSFTRIATTDNEVGNRYDRNSGHPDGGGTSLFSDAEGKVEGEFFIANTDTQRFRTGIREFKLLDITADNEEDATSIGVTTYAAQGVIDVFQRTVRSTRIRNVMTSAQTSSSSSISGRRSTTSTTAWNVVTGERRVDGVTVTPPRTVRQSDPLAQTFFVSDQDGVFITSIDIYFNSKDATIPAQLQLRPTVNGVPASDEIMPGSVVFKSPANINVSSDATAVTTFTFEEPVFLMPYEEYAVVLLAECDSYNVYIAETEQFILNSTEKRITSQPAMGSLFKSQNGSTWEPDQTKDLMFKMKRADFSTTGSSIILRNGTVPLRLLGTDPISTVQNDATITINHEDHGLNVNDQVKIYGFDSNTQYAGIFGNRYNGTRNVTSIDHDNFTVEAGATPTLTSSVGGTVVLNSQNIPFEEVWPYIETNIPQSTAIAVSGKFISGKSTAGNETPYTQDPSFGPLALRNRNVFSVPKVIAADYIETTNLSAGEKSATIKVDLTTSSSYVSPVIDMQRASLWLTHNRIDNADSAGSGLTNINTPFNFISETDKTGGTIIAKHITRPVTLAEAAVGLKVILGANRPSVADFEVYYKAISDDARFEDAAWIEVAKERNIPSDENPTIFRDYEYIVGGPGGLSVPFNRFVLKIVMKSFNNAKVPTFKDLRVIALAV